MTAPDYTRATFMLSVAQLAQLPADQGIEVAFIGRSNAGKSSVLNQLTCNRALARVSKTPGRTQHINLFALDAERRLADLPGYGFAKVPLAVKKEWQQLINSYLATRACLRGIILVMDIRHPLKPFDCDMLEWASESQLSTHILLNKADKLTQREAAKVLNDVKNRIATLPTENSVQTFSALKGAGAKELRAQLNKWFMLAE